MDVNKAELRKEFAKDWEKHYKLKSLTERGFERRKCGKCGRMFWSIGERERCGDAGCIGYPFIGNTPVKKKLGYVDTWKAIEKYFTSHGHGYVKPYPTVARWRNDLYFTVASINDFQPYVVNGELDPPHNPLIVPQPCIRFPDISNVGVTGRHYTNFVMIGQHAFNTKKSGLFYWKDEAVRHDLSYLKALGIPETELVFQEDVWAGGGNFGPCMEYFCGGLELGNCVFMQYEVTPHGNRELKTKVIDMGAGLSRLAWITGGDLTSYETVFGKVITDMKRMAGVKVDRELFAKFAKLSGGLDEDEVQDMEAEKARVAQMLGISKEELFRTIEPLTALYASADHMCTLLFTITDGMLPSNAGGGYNLRMIARRVFGFEEQYGYSLDYAKILEGHAEHLEYLFPHLKEGVRTTIDVVLEEKKRYTATKEKAKVLVANLVKKSGAGHGAAPNKEREPGGGTIKPDQLFMFYKSHGIPPEYVSRVAKENGVKVEVPGNFYKLVREGEGGEGGPAGKAQEDAPTMKLLAADVVSFPRTEELFYGKDSEFSAKVLGVLHGKYVVLDRTGFYPEGGGQVSDTGTLEVPGPASCVVKVKSVMKQSGVALHEMEDGSKFRKGGHVKGSVDMERRRTIARHHTVTHMVNAACREVLGPHIWQGGSFKDEEKAHLDVTHYKRITNEELERIELKVNEYVMRDMPISTQVLPRNEAERKHGFRLYQGGAVPGKELRVVSVGDIDHEACGGTHQMLKSTGEIGYFKLVKRESVQDGIERLVYKAGVPAARYVQEREAMLREASAVLSVSEPELTRSVERFFREWKEQRKKLEGLSEVIVQEEAKDIIEHGRERPAVRILDLDSDMLRKLGMLIARSERSSAILINKQGNLLCAAGPSSAHKARDLLQKAISQLGGSGGGSDVIAQGKVAKVAMVQV